MSGYGNKCAVCITRKKIIPFLQMAESIIICYFMGHFTLWINNSDPMKANSKISREFQSKEELAKVNSTCNQYGHWIKMDANLLRNATHFSALLIGLIKRLVPMGDHGMVFLLISLNSLTRQIVAPLACGNCSNRY